MEEDLFPPVHHARHWLLTIQPPWRKLGSSLLPCLAWDPGVFAKVWSPSAQGPAFPGAPCCHLPLGSCLLPGAPPESGVKISTLTEHGTTFLSPRCSTKGIQKEDICPQVSALVSATKMRPDIFISISLAELLPLDFSNGNTWIYLVWLHICLFLANFGVLREGMNALHCLLFVLPRAPFSLSSPPGNLGNSFSMSWVLGN